MLLTLTIFHTLLSIAALCLGIIALQALFDDEIPEHWVNLFLGMAVASTATGFMFPFTGFTPLFITGIVSTVVLIAVYVGRFVFGFQGPWRGIYAAGVVASEFFLFLVTIAQGFDKIPFFHSLAPTGTEPTYAVIQFVNFAAFFYIAFDAVKKFRVDPDEE
jgi:hypothetical protein